jgi:VIT1/CCC1 family predicted Fe2+/Mn2+ transporter
LDDKVDLYKALELQGTVGQLSADLIKRLEMARQDEIIHQQKLHMSTARYDSESHEESRHSISAVAAELDTENEASGNKKVVRRSIVSGLADTPDNLVDRTVGMEKQMRTPEMSPDDPSKHFSGHQAHQSLAFGINDNFGQP